jgi:16S rRNA (cytosine967-C5)-methyltransferase
MFAQSYLHTSVQILKEYKGEEPFASFLKKFFSANKKYGSRDRKQITHLCYCYFRLGKSLMHLEVVERIIAGLYLCNQISHPVLAFAKPQWNDLVTENKEAKLKTLHQQLGFTVTDIFPFQEHISLQIDPHSFASSFLEQPDIYLRIRPGNEAKIKSKLKNAEIPFLEISNNCIAVPPSTKIETHLKINNEIVVQDVSSQKVLIPIINFVKNTNKNLDAWDCCAASGGKSILLKDTFPNIRLTVSDIRESILANLRKRFKEANITNYTWFIADVSAPQFRHYKQYDLVICDAPCSGSGTWGRTPEQLYFFKKERINYYASLQKKIALNASQYLKEAGMFLYITCSVFKEENEKVVEFMQQNSSLQLENIQYFTGYQQKADTLFAALFVKRK